MPTTTRAVLEGRLSEIIGDYPATMTSDGSGNSTSNLRDAALKDISSDANSIQGFVEITSGDANGEIRRISAYDGTDDITPAFNFSSTPSASCTYLIHRYDPLIKRTAMENAIRLCFPKLYVSIRDESLIIDNLLSNPDFESALDGGAHPSWTNVNSPTIALETTRVYHGTSSNSITSHGSSGAGQTYQEPAINIQEVLGKTVTFTARVYDTTANQARIRLDWDGTNFDNSDYHNGDDEWQKLEVSATIPSTATRIRAICEVLVGTNQAFFDATKLTIAPVQRYTIPTTLAKGPYRVEMQSSESDTDNNYRPVTYQNPPRRGRRLRIHGIDQLSVPSTVSGTTEVGDGKIDLIIARAAEIFFTMLWQRYAGQESNEFRNQFQYWQAQRFAYEQIYSMQPPNASRPSSIWKIEEDSSGRYLVFTDGR